MTMEDKQKHKGITYQPIYYLMFFYPFFSHHGPYQESQANHNKNMKLYGK